MTLTDLPVEDYERTIEGFLPQTELDNCYPAGLANIINELGRSKGIRGMRFSLSAMDRICGYRAGEHCQDELVPERVNQALEPFEFELASMQGEGCTVEGLREVAVDGSSSFPLVNVESRYFEDLGVRTRGVVTWDHVLIVLGVDHDVVYYYDPYETILKRYPAIEGPPRVLSIPDFLRVWENAFYRRGMCWVRPLPTRQAHLSEGE